MTKDQAKALYDSGFWKELSARERVEFQLFEERLCMPFDIIQEAVEATLGRSVWTHEFAHPDNLRKEFLGDRPAPTFQDIVNLIPESKRILVASPSVESS